MAAVYSESLASPDVGNDRNGGFAIEVPSGWLIDRSGQQGTRVLFLEPDAMSAFQANLNVLAQSLGAMTSEDYLSLSRLQVKQITGRTSPEVDEPAAQYEQARIIEWHAMFGSLHLKIRQLFVCAGSWAYVVSATAPYARFAEYRAVFHAALDSFQITRQPVSAAVYVEAHP